MGMWIPDQDMGMVEEVLVEMVMVDSMETVGSLELVLGEVEAFEDEDFHVTVQELNTEEVAEEVVAEEKAEKEDDTEGSTHSLLPPRGPHQAAGVWGWWAHQAPPLPPPGVLLATWPSWYLIALCLISIFYPIFL